MAIEGRSRWTISYCSKNLNWSLNLRNHGFWTHEYPHLSTSLRPNSLKLWLSEILGLEWNSIVGCTYSKTKLLKIKALFAYGISLDFTPIKAGPQHGWWLDKKNVIMNNACVNHIFIKWKLFRPLFRRDQLLLKFEDIPYTGRAFILGGSDFKQVGSIVELRSS